MRPVLLTAVILSACAFASVFSPATSQPPDRLPDLAPALRADSTDPPTPYGVGKRDILDRPAASCASASCHGGGQIGKVGSEYSTWAPEIEPKGGSDPHNKAYRVLFNPVSVRMGEILKLTPHTDRRCLTCHAVDSGTDETTREQIRSDGVGCSGCHGSADKWISAHYTPEWQGLSNRQKWDKYGFVPTKNLVARTLNCASCHVGDGDHDMNHDFIAAGHPRLAFEPARFQFQPGYRKHWTEKTRQPDFEVRLWVIGQATTLRAAVNLLHERAKRAEKNDEDTPWPEFSGYSCYSCHQKIGEADLRGSASAAVRPPGVPGWEVWSNTALEIAANACGEVFPGLRSPNLKADLNAVVELRQLMESKRTPPAKEVVKRSKKALDQLDTWLVAMQNAEDNPKLETVPRGMAERLAHRLAANALSKDGKLLADHDWDALATNYLGCAAMFHANGGSAENKWGDELKNVHVNLEFQPEKKTKDVEPNERFNSPAFLTRGKLTDLQKNFELLRAATAPKGGNR